MTEKPLGRKAYGSIPHLPGSRTGPTDSTVPEGQGRICTDDVRDDRDEIIVQEKLDGSCCAVGNVDGDILALTRSGYEATTSPYEQHDFFAAWVRERWTRFDELLDPGERIVGEWLAMAHGTLYDPDHPGFRPFIAFDLMTEAERVPYDVFHARVNGRLPVPRLIHRGGALSFDRLWSRLEPSGHGAEAVEGAVYRVERAGEVDYLAKWVRPDKIDGKYFEQNHPEGPIYHWRP